MKFKLALVLCLMSVLPSGANAKPPTLEVTLKGVLITTGGVLGAYQANKLDCWSNMGHLISEGYSLASSGYIPPEIVAGVFALNAGCALGLIVAGSGGAYALCRVGDYVFEFAKGKSKSSPDETPGDGPSS